MKDGDDSETDDAFERYVAFQTSAGARFEFKTGCLAAAIGLPSFSAAAICWLVPITGWFSNIAYGAATIAGVVTLIHLFTYFYRRNAWF